MPRSRNRRKHHHQHPAPHTRTPATRLRRTAAFVVSVIAAILGLAVAYFTQGPDIFWLLTGAASGAVIGYLVGRSMDKSIEKK